MATTRSSVRIALALVVFAFFPISARAIQAPDATPSPASPKAALIVGVVIDEAGITMPDVQRSCELVLNLFDRLPAGSQMVVAAFSGEKRIVLPPSSDRAEIANALEGFKPGENAVALPDGLFDVVEYLTGRPAEARVLVLFSAGRLRDGDLQFEDPLNIASSKQLRIFAVALGQGDGKMLRRVAKLTGGEYVRLEVADAPMLAQAMKPASASSSAAMPARDSSPEPEPTPRAATGLLGAAAVFFSLGGLLMLGIVILLVRKLSASPQEAPNRAQADPPPVAAKSMRAPISTPSLELDELTHEETDEGALEKTLVVNASPILRALSGPGAGKNFPLQVTGRTSIGRSRRNDIVVPEDAASAQHCRIDREGDSYVIHDLGATNGTWVNGSRTERAVLQHGDRLKIGETVFTVSLFGDRA